MYLGLDLGTSSVKVIVIDDDGLTVAQSSCSLSISHPHPLWSEQNPDDWLKAAEKSISGIPKQIRENIQGIGLSGQMHGAVLIDKKNRPLRPAILWNDGRSFKECHEMEKNNPQLRSITGNQIMPGFTAPKMAWLEKHEPQIFSLIHKILLPKDYLRLIWSGRYATDTSDASGTLWLDIEKRVWSEAAINTSKLSLEQLPEIFEGHEITGLISQATAQKLGIPIVPIIAGAGDQAAGAIGSSVINPNDASLALGTSGVIFIVTDGFLPNPLQGTHAFCHSIPSTWHQMAVTLSAASAVDWCANLTGYVTPSDAYDDAEKKGSSEKVMFLPYLSGERTPHNNPHASGMLYGLKTSTDRAAIIHAALEGVAFALTDGLKALINAGGQCDSISVIGGGSRSTYWGKIIANCLNKTLIYRDDSKCGPAKGAAELARCGIMGINILESLPESPIVRVIEPEKNYTEYYQNKISEWRELYQNTREFNQR